MSKTTPTIKSLLFLVSAITLFWRFDFFVFLNFKIKMKNCSTCCCDNPALALGLIRVGIVLLFLIPGVMKFMNPDMFLGMLEAKVGLTGLAKTAGYWAVVIVEVLGAIAVALGNLVPRMLYKVALLGFLVILIVAIATVHWGNSMGVLSHFLMMLNVVALIVTRPMCPIGVCGDKS